tara:strand:+ start:7460 stop:7885 length:426 start_codon:yes stop_codon:yes gene_type:complete
MEDFYNKKDRQWVKVDKSGNIIKEIVNDLGIKLKYFDHYGYQPLTFKPILDHNGKADPYGQLDYCKSVDCPDCYCCIWVGYMHLPPRKKQKQIFTKVNKKPSKWDKLAKAATKKTIIKNTDKNKHPLYDYIMEKFQGKEIK